MVSEEIVKELEDVYQKAVDFVKTHFSETEKYPRDKRLTIITLMGYLIQLEQLKSKRK